LNQAEEDVYKEELSKRGFIIVNKKPFDIAVINTCAVTHKAERESRQTIRQLKKQCPMAKIILTGCANLKLPEIDYYIKDKEKFLKIFFQHFNPPSPVYWRRGRGMREMRTRVNIKIQTGCDNCCTYCYTRIARGKSRSFSPKSIIQQIKNKEKQDIKEVVLTGVNIGQYKYKKIDLAGLIKKILQETNIPRIRLSSINPEYVYKNKEFKNLFKDKRLCQHLHLSLQSGSDKILKSMNRHYTTKQYLEIINAYYKLYPLFGFTTDVIVGFPDEAEKNFKDTCDFVKKNKFLKIHIFRYSPRQKTAASRMKNQIPEIIKNQRAEILQKINKQLQTAFSKKMKNRKVEVLFESKKDSQWFGHAANYFPVLSAHPQICQNRIILVKI
jgi:threonylcarbamoyladenosine tRNA methylthiotransferase MtaB